MSVESAVLVRLPLSAEVTALCTDLDAAHRRATKALPGDRTDVVRFEIVSAQLEALAGQTLVSGEADAVTIPLLDRPGFSVVRYQSDIQAFPADAVGRVAGWLAAGDIAVEVRDPFGVGRTDQTIPLDPTPMPPDEIWRAPEGEEGSLAAAARFREQLDRALAGGPEAAVSPSGVANGVLTRTLRNYVGLDGTRVDVPVRYRDGSVARAFPLRSLKLAAAAPPQWRVLRFALLSIRHTEMDVAVDGAWLRNTTVSRRRPAGETDELVYDLSRRQLQEITSRQPISLHLYQTGLETAIVGFYRAVVHHILEYPGSLAVTPMFFRKRPPDAPTRLVAGYEQETHFARGKAWAT
jgi:hypothetical protein